MTNNNSQQYAPVWGEISKRAVNMEDMERIALREEYKK
jgi:hypothetical protein